MNKNEHEGKIFVGYFVGYFVGLEKSNIQSPTDYNTLKGFAVDMPTGYLLKEINPHHHQQLFGVLL